MGVLYIKIRGVSCHHPYRCAPGFQGTRCENVQEASSNANRAGEEQAVAGGENRTLN